ncbi:MAG: hypothetical protein M3417_03395 [Actinomycetota bacterium]|nr:hypothetical protein [Actinomycetota bacterium]
MLPAAVERILSLVPDDALVLDVGGWSAPFNRADHVLDLLPYESRGGDGAHGPPWERFTARTWVQRDACDKAPWPWPDDHFAFATCVGTLEELRDPIWVCQELSRVARAGYVEVSTIESELIQEAGDGGPWLGRSEHRWFCELSGGELVFTHKPHSIHHDTSLRVVPRWQERMAPEDLVQGLFWERALPARERFLVGAERAAALEELRRRLRDRFEPSTAEVRARQARDVARQGVKLAKRPARQAAGRVLDELTRRRDR